MTCDPTRLLHPQSAIAFIGAAECAIIASVVVIEVRWKEGS